MLHPVIQCMVVSSNYIAVDSCIYAMVVASSMEIFLFCLGITGQVHLVN